MAQTVNPLDTEVYLGTMLVTSVLAPAPIKSVLRRGEVVVGVGVRVGVRVRVRVGRGSGGRVAVRDVLHVAERGDAAGLAVMISASGAGNVKGPGCDARWKGAGFLELDVGKHAGVAVEATFGGFIGDLETGDVVAAVG